MVNENGKNVNGNYNINVYIDKVIFCGGGCGIFCVFCFGGVVIQNVDLFNNGNNVIFIENCYNVLICSGIVNGGGEVCLFVCLEFFNNKDIWIILQVNNNFVCELLCGENINFFISGNV